MGTSFIRYRGAGFWATDTFIQLWMRLFEQEVRQMEDPPQWLRDAAEYWEYEAGATHSANPRLDEYAPDAERAAVVAQVAQRALERLRAHGTHVSAAWLDSLDLAGGNVTWHPDIPSDPLLSIGDALI